MTGEQALLILALMADLRLTVERLAAENTELRRQIAATSLVSRAEPGEPPTTD